MVMYMYRKRQREASTPQGGRSKIRKLNVPQQYMQTRRTERKRKYYGLAPLTIRSDSVYLYNPLYYLVTGGSRDQRIGTKVQKPFLHYSMALTPTALNAIGDPIDQGVAVRIVVFTHNKEWYSGAEGAWAINTGGTGTPITNADILKDTGSDRLVASFLNVDEIRVLHDRVHVLQRDSGGAVPAATDANGPHKNVKGSVKLPDHRFNDGTNAFGRDDNIYVAVMGTTSSGVTVPDCARIATNLLITYDDA